MSEVPLKFSDRLGGWLTGSQPKTLDSLLKMAEDQSFAVLYLVLMLFPALPLPTGGITHIFEVIVILVAIEQIIGRDAVWVPESLARKAAFDKFAKGEAARKLLKRIRWFEDRSSTSWNWLFDVPFATRLSAMLVLIFSLAAFLAPPFSGLDTLPSLGVVLFGLASIFKDARLAVVGAVVGSAGVALSVGLGAAVYQFLRGFI